MTTSASIGFGLEPWGTSRWGVNGEAASGAMPSGVLPFDIYRIESGSPMAALFNYPEIVVTAGSEAQRYFDDTGDQFLASGGSKYSPTVSSLDIDKPVPPDFTLEVTTKFVDLPSDFNDIKHRHAFIGVFSEMGACAGLFFSEIGIAYSGAVHIDAGGDLVLDTPVQTLPGSQLFVSEDAYWTVRLAVSLTTGAVYIYVTKTSELLALGHQLRYIMPVIPSSAAAVTPDTVTRISVCGTPGDASILGLSHLYLGTGLIIPGLPPKAEPGADQAVRMCSVLQLDGTASISPQDSALLYKWRLIDAPTGSQYIHDEVDGRSYPGNPATGYTNRFYSTSLSILDGIQPILQDDVLVVGGKVYRIESRGLDTHGFFVRIDSYTLPDNLSSNTAFKYIRQNGLNTPTSPKPTFYPDVPGIFKFDLTVFDGVLFSEPTQLVANCMESVVARGVVPDVSFIWNYLSDFWRLVEDTERITTFWQGLAQVAAAELLTLWQVDYSKSLRDIQRTFQRRWMHYDLLMQESIALRELSTVRAMYSGIESEDILFTGTAVTPGTHVDVQLVGLDVPLTLALGPADTHTPYTLQNALQAALRQIDERFSVHVLFKRDGNYARVRIDAPFVFSIASTTTCPFFHAGQVNGVPQGTSGAGVVTSQTYRAERSLQYLDIKQGDFLCIDGVAYRIGRVLDDPSDPFYFQRLALLDPLPVPAGTSWSLAGTVTSKDLNFWDGLCEQDDYVLYEVLDTATQNLLEVTGRVLGASSATPLSLAVDATPVGLYLSDSSRYFVFLKGVLRKKYVPLDPLIADVPFLQEKIVAKDDTQVLRRNVDYAIDTFRGQKCFRFITPVPEATGGPDIWQGQLPPAQLWAETSYLDNRPRIEANFGIPAGFTLDDLSTLPSNVDYLSAVRGLWFAYTNGPTLFNLRAGTQILLGLPFAEEAGTIVEIRTDFSATTGRILVQDAADTTIVRSYSFPVALSLETNPSTGVPYAVGDAVTQFAPLVQGVEVVDWVKNPEWFQGYLEQGAFFEVEKFFKFLVRVDSAAFNLSALLFVRSFILKIKPTYAYPLFVVRSQLGNTTVTTSDAVHRHGLLHMDTGVCALGVAPIYDQHRPAGGGSRNQYDNDADLATAPTFPDPTLAVAWAYDRAALCPEDAIVRTLCTTLPAGTKASLDSVLSYDLSPYKNEAAYFVSGLQVVVPAAGLEVGTPSTIQIAGTVTVVNVEISAVDTGNPNTYRLVVEKNGAEAASIPFTLAEGAFVFQQAISFAVTSGDVLRCFIRSTTARANPIYWGGVFIRMGQAVTWSYDSTLPAGSYCVYRGT